MGYYLCFPRETNRPNFGCREGKSSSFFPYTGICGTSVYHKSVLTILHNYIYDRLAVRTCDDWCLYFPPQVSLGPSIAIGLPDPSKGQGRLSLSKD